MTSQPTTSQPTAYQLVTLARMGYDATTVAAMPDETWKNHLRMRARLLSKWAEHGAPAGDLSFADNL